MVRQFSHESHELTVDWRKPDHHDHQPFLGVAVRRKTKVRFEIRFFLYESLSKVLGKTWWFWWSGGLLFIINGLSDHHLDHHPTTTTTAGRKTCVLSGEAE